MYEFDQHSHLSDGEWIIGGSKPDYPPVTPAVPVAEGDELRERLLEEFDRRIEKDEQVEREQPNAGGTYAGKWRKEWYEQQKRQFLESVGRDE